MASIGIWPQKRVVIRRGVDPLHGAVDRTRAGLAAVASHVLAQANRMFRPPCPGGAVSPDGDRPQTPTGGEARCELAAFWSASRPGLIVILGLTVLINLLRIALPLFIFQVLDRVMSSRSLDTLALLTVLAVACVCIAAAAEMIRRWLLVSWGDYVEYAFGQKLFVAGLTTRAEAGNRRAPAGPQRTLGELAHLRRFVSGTGAIAWLDVWFAPLFLVVVYLIHPVLAAIVLFSTATMLVLGVLNERMTRAARASAQSAKRSLTRFVSAAETGPEALCSRRVAERLAGRWADETSQRRGGNMAVRLTGIAVSDGMRLVEMLQRIACYGVGAMLAIAGTLTVGGVIAAAVLGRIASSPVRKAMANWRALALAMASYKRLKRRIKEAQHVRAPLHDRKAPLALAFVNTGLSHARSRRGPPLIQGFNLVVEPGDLVAVHGPSGSGKSTVARLAAGRLMPSHGRVYLGDLNVCEVVQSTAPYRIGYLPQDSVLPEGTVREIISNFSMTGTKSVVAAATHANVHHVVMALKDGYETWLAPNRQSLSGGELKRIAIARALYRAPPLIVLDAPEANLDSASITHLMGSLAVLKQQGCVIVVTSLSTAFLDLAEHELALASRPMMAGDRGPRNPVDQRVGIHLPDTV